MRLSLKNTLVNYRLPTSIVSILFETDFSEYTNGVDIITETTDWSKPWHSDIELNIQETASANVGSKWAESPNTATSDALRVAACNAAGTLTDCQVLVLAKTDSTIREPIRVKLRGSGASGDETAYFVSFQDGDTLKISKYLNGTASDLATLSFTWTTDTFYWIRFEIIDNVLKAKVWEYGTSEPSSWTIGDGSTVTDNDIASGWTGIGFLTTAVKHWDYFAVSEGSTVLLPS